MAMTWSSLNVRLEFLAGMVEICIPLWSFNVQYMYLSEDLRKGQKVVVFATSGFTLLFSAFTLDSQSGDREGVGSGG